uniref:Uncharacterized protein n=1 Tax=Brassica oleracea TaxID=3712 RepID=A0A3P6DHT4_BRAOL|nr:unnamed protein product [Brassica oleracea]
MKEMKRFLSTSSCRILVLIILSLQIRRSVHFLHGR